jgi:hypothetical protein
VKRDPLPSEVVALALYATAWAIIATLTCAVYLAAKLGAHP